MPQFSQFQQRPVFAQQTFLPRPNAQFPFRANNNFPTQKHLFFQNRQFNQSVNNQFRSPMFNNNQFRPPMFNNNNSNKKNERLDEPMDTSSGNSRRSQPRKFISTELHTQNISENENQSFDLTHENSNNIPEYDTNISPDYCNEYYPENAYSSPYYAELNEQFSMPSNSNELESISDENVNFTTIGSQTNAT